MLRVSYLIALSTSIFAGSSFEAFASDWRDEVFSFHREFLQEALNPPPETRLRKVCAAGPGGANEAQVTLAGFDGRTVSIAIFSDRAIRDVTRAVWLKPRMLFGEEREKTFAKYPELTLDWGWVYDRNQDGLADWFSFLVGANPVAPEGTTSLPDLKKKLTKDQVLFFLENTELRFWEIIDSDFDGEPDAMLVPSKQPEGWLEGVMLLEGVDGRSAPKACCWRSELGSDVRRDCEPTAKGCVSKDGSYKALSEQFSPGLLKDLPNYLRWINGSIAACRVPRGTLAAAPRKW